MTTPITCACCGKDWNTIEEYFRHIERRKRDERAGSDDKDS